MIGAANLYVLGIPSPPPGSVHLMHIHILYRSGQFCYLSFLFIHICCLDKCLDALDDMHVEEHTV
jgi:hypothetical protein